MVWLLFLWPVPPMNRPFTSSKTSLKGKPSGGMLKSNDMTQWRCFIGRRAFKRNSDAASGGHVGLRYPEIKVSGIEAPHNSQTRISPQFCDVLKAEVKVNGSLLRIATTPQAWLVACAPRLIGAAKQCQPFRWQLLAKVGIEAAVSLVSWTQIRWALLWSAAAKSSKWRWIELTL